MTFLTKDINSLVHPSSCYGKAGDEVEIISGCDLVNIVRHIGKKVGFPVYAEFLSDVKPETKTSAVQIIINKVAVKKRTTVTIQNPSLF